MPSRSGNSSQYEIKHNLVALLSKLCERLQARLEALESGVDEDAFQVDDDDEEFDMEAEVDDESSGALLRTSVH